MSRRVSIAVLAMSLVAALSTGYLLLTNSEALITTRPFVVASQAIPAYAVISRDLLTERQLPATLIEEPIFVSPDELLGLITTVPIPAQTVIYRHFAVPIQAFHLSPDPTLEIVSFPVDTTKAVGGRVRPGHRINLYRVKAQKVPETIDVEQALRMKGAGVELLAAAIPVVDARGARGEDVFAVQGTNPDDDSHPASRAVAVSILTVSVPPDVAKEVIRLVGEREAGYELWVTLAPVPEAELELGAGGGS